MFCCVWLFCCRGVFILVLEEWFFGIFGGVEFLIWFIIVKVVVVIGVWELEIVLWVLLFFFIIKFVFWIVFVFVFKWMFVGFFIFIIVLVWCVRRVINNLIVFLLVSLVWVFEFNMVNFVIIFVILIWDLLNNMDLIMLVDCIKYIGGILFFFLLFCSK